MIELKIIPTDWMESGLYRFNSEYDFNSYCGKDFQKGWRVRIELPVYKHPNQSEFREGIVLNPEIISKMMGKENPVLELQVEEEFRGRRNRKMPRRYSYYRILNAWLIKDSSA